MFLTRCISLARSYFSPSGPRLSPNMIIQFHGFRYHFYAENSPFLGENPFWFLFPYIQLLFQYFSHSTLNTYLPLKLPREGSPHPSWGTGPNPGSSLCLFPLRSCPSSKSSWFYLQNRPRSLTTPTAVILLLVSWSFFTWIIPTVSHLLRSLPSSHLFSSQQLKWCF